MMSFSALRHFDLGTLRSFVTIADAGSMTQAATRLHLTQSAISMQIKRLEQALGLSVFERSPQGMIPTSAGEQLLHFARQMLALNDEAWGRLTAPDFEGQVRLGVPIDLLHPLMPKVLRAFSRDFPRVEIKLSVANTYPLREQFEAGQLDVVLTTELEPQKGGKVIRVVPLLWTGAPQGNAWKKQPLPIGFSSRCAFRRPVIEALDQAGIDWIDIARLEGVGATVAMTAADLCVSADLMPAWLLGNELEVIDSGERLPPLPEHCIILYCADHPGNRLGQILAEYIERTYA
ncbi:MAG TPA: LysR family transcriptional regulator [Thiolinea sp.]|nr:LysR family transcriptional regulator [Thiolinea sp.]